jgi:hypothetical protein
VGEARAPQKGEKQMNKRLLAVAPLAVPVLAGCGSSKSIPSADNTAAQAIVVKSDVEPYTKFTRSLVELTGTVAPADATVVVDGVNAAVGNGRWKTRVQLATVGQNEVSIVASKPGLPEGKSSTVLIRARSRRELAVLQAQHASERRRAAAKRARAAARREATRQAAAATVAVPDEIGERLDVAKDDVRSAGLLTRVIGGGTFGVVVESNWTVCETKPAPGSQVHKDTPVKLIIDRVC